jgi:hypothetical protein
MNERQHPEDAKIAASKMGRTQRILPRLRKPILMRLLSAAIVYVVSYIALSFTGGYAGMASGLHRTPWGFAVGDCYEWQPRFGSGHISRDASRKNVWDADAAGIFFAPAIYLDQRFVHRRVMFLKSDWSVDPSAVMPPSRLHPRERPKT